MENRSLQCLKQIEVPYKYDKWEREFKRRSSLTRHIHSNHEPIDVTLCKVKLKKWKLTTSDWHVHWPNKISEETHSYSGTQYAC